MDEEEWIQLFSLFATFAGIVVIYGSCHTKRWQWGDRLMVGGAVFGTLGMGMVMLIVYGAESSLSREAELAVIGVIGLGILLFAMGFVVDQICYRAALSYRRQLIAIDEAAKTLLEVGGRSRE